MIKAILVKWQQELSVIPVSDLFTRTIYLVLLWSVAKLLPMGDIIWGEGYFIELFNPYTGPDRFAMLLNDPVLRGYWPFVVWPFIALLVFGIVGFHNFITRVLVAYLYVLIHFGNFEVSSGGHHLMQQVLFFHILFFKVQPEDLSKPASLKRLVHHLGFYAIWVNIAILYLVAGITKLQGDTWLSGEAVTLALSIDHYSLPMVFNHLKEHNWLMSILTYLTLAYQLLFPILIWMKKPRKPLLICGTAFHLSIAFIVGLTDFGLMLIACYTIFLDPITADKFIAYVRKLSPIKTTRAYLPS